MSEQREKPLGQMKVAELTAAAAARGVAVPEGATRKQILQALRGAEASSHQPEAGATEPKAQSPEPGSPPLDFKPVEGVEGRWEAESAVIGQTDDGTIPLMHVIVREEVDGDDGASQVRFAIDESEEALLEALDALAEGADQEGVGRGRVFFATFEEAAAALNGLEREVVAGAERGAQSAEKEGEAKAAEASSHRPEAGSTGAGPKEETHRPEAGATGGSKETHRPEAGATGDALADAEERLAECEREFERRRAVFVRLCGGKIQSEPSHPDPAEQRRLRAAWRQQRIDAAATYLEAMGGSTTEADKWLKRAVSEAKRTLNEANAARHKAQDEVRKLR